MLYVQWPQRCCLYQRIAGYFSVLLCICSVCVCSSVCMWSNMCVCVCGLMCACVWSNVFVSVCVVWCVRVCGLTCVSVCVVWCVRVCGLTCLLCCVLCFQWQTQSPHKCYSSMRRWSLLAVRLSRLFHLMRMNFHSPVTLSDLTLSLSHSTWLVLLLSFANISDEFRQQSMTVS